MLHLEIDVCSGKLILEQIISYINSEDTFILTHYPKNSIKGYPIKIFSNLNDAKEYIKKREDILL